MEDKIMTKEEMEKRIEELELKNERLKKLLHYTTKECLNKSPLTEDESLETGISEQPVGNVFSNWDNNDDSKLEEPVFDEDSLREELAERAIDEPAIEETFAA